MNIKAKRNKTGDYTVTREDGRIFRILKGKMEWVIEAQDTLTLDCAPTLNVAIAGLKNQWTPQSRETV